MCTINELTDICTSIKIEEGKGIRSAVTLEIPMDHLNLISVRNNLRSDVPYYDCRCEMTAKKSSYPDLLTKEFQVPKTTPKEIPDYDIYNTKQEFVDHIVERIVESVKDIRVYNNKVVVMKFKDGTYTKAECYGEDIFDLNFGLTICLLKKIVGNVGKNKNYKKLLDKLGKLMKKKDRERQKHLEEKEKKEQKKIDDLNRKAEIAKIKTESWRINLTNCISEALKANGLTNPVITMAGESTSNNE